MIGKILIALTMMGSPMASDPGAGVVSTHPLTLAHRGTYAGSQFEPGNNAGAWKQLLDLDPRVVVEMDMWETTDHVPTIHHDPALNTDTNGTGRISGRSWDYVSHHQYNNGQPIPGYRQIISNILSPDSSAMVMIDLKAHPSATAWSKLNATLGLYRSRVVFYSSTSNTYTLAAKSNRYLTAFYQDGGSGSMPSVSTILKYGTFAYTGGVQQYTASQRTKMANAGIRTIGWGQDEATWKQQADLGAWAVSTDHSDAFVNWRG